MCGEADEPVQGESAFFFVWRRSGLFPVEKKREQAMKMPAPV